MPPRYAPIGSLDVLSQIQREQLSTNYWLFLAHEVLAYPDEFDRLSFHIRTNTTRKNPTPPPYIILDNSVIELGDPCSGSALQEAAAIVQPDVMVLPDVLGDQKATQKAIHRYINNNLIPHDVMFVPQGSTSQELIDCATWIHQYASEEGFDPIYWGIPRWVANKFFSREPLIRIINELSGQHKIHLLGMSQNIRDDFKCLHLPNVMGIDSANPMVLGWKGVDMDWVVNHVPRDGYLENCRELNDTMRRNLQWVNDISVGP